MVHFCKIFAVYYLLWNLYIPHAELSLSTGKVWIFSWRGAVGSIVIHSLFELLTVVAGGTRWSLDAPAECAADEAGHTKQINAEFEGFESYVDNTWISFTPNPKERATKLTLFTAKPHFMHLLLEGLRRSIYLQKHLTTHIKFIFLEATTAHKITQCLSIPTIYKFGGD